MTKVRTFSRVFPSYHPRKGEPTYFVEKILNQLSVDYTIGSDYYELLIRLNFDRIKAGKLTVLDLDTFWHYLDPYLNGEKSHTIRAGQHFKPGDTFSPRVWSGKPYQSPQIIIAPDITVEKTWEFELYRIEGFMQATIDTSSIPDSLIDIIAHNDGLNLQDFLDWFKYPKPSGPMQIICWNKDIEY